MQGANEAVSGKQQVSVAPCPFSARLWIAQGVLSLGWGELLGTQWIGLKAGTGWNLRGWRGRNTRLAFNTTWHFLGGRVGWSFQVRAPAVRR